ncbi:MAG: glucose-6-phosphate isomerase [Bacteroidetes bacterium CG2_30_33_31]|nr:MAG: glucose-6-phosphate isomerase [Bacteroidetes bacterium CG2_30_33_31]
MNNLLFRNNNSADYIDDKEIEALQRELSKLQISISEKKCAGNEFLGWVNLPSEISENFLKDIEDCAKKIRDNSEYFVIIGIGGSYLGARAVIESLRNSFSDFDKSAPKILYAGHNLSEDYLSEMVNFLKDKSFSMAVISKSGTTTEPAVAFRLLKQLLEKKVGQEAAKERIIAITDKEKGALKILANQNDYKTYVVPDNVGGRFSVLTAVGLLPIAVAGFDISRLVKGAKKMQEICGASSLLAENPAAHYAASRNILYQKGFKTEILVSFRPKLQYFGEWWKQLFGESEGKEGKGIFPAAVNFTTDLHSMGQYIQDGQRTIFETFITVEKPNKSLKIPSEEQNLDGLNYLAGKDIEFVNRRAEMATAIAHVDGGVPVLQIIIPEINENSIGQLIYFFEKACAYSGLILGVNPFDQPGVEAYKKNMFSLLGKPGFEDKKLNERAGL